MRLEAKTKHLIENWLPPGLFTILRGMTGIKWSGDYASWAEVQRKATGYDSEVILARVKDSLLKVRNGEAVSERDSVLLEEIQYSWPMLAALMWIAVQSKGLLNIIDFGGSLGSTYFQNRKFLQSVPEVHWNIVEQKSFVDVGKTYFEDGSLKFFCDIETCREARSPNTILFSSVLQYLEQPYAFLEKVKAIEFEFILLDRTPFTRTGTDRLTLQTVPARIYAASYPAWFFGRQRFYTFFEDTYDVIATFETSDRANIPSIFEGCIMRKK